MHDESAKANGDPPPGSGAAAEALQEPLVTVPLEPTHRLADFVCNRSERVQGFLRDHAAKYVAANFARVFILPNPADPNEVWGYYTLSAASIPYGDLTAGQQKRVPLPGIPAPLAIIGYMGRHDGAEPGLGAGLIVDAARRVHRDPHIAAWGLILDAEARNADLMKWYESVGFRPKKVEKGQVTGVMYAPLTNLIPELNPAMAAEREKARQKAIRARAMAAQQSPG
jgi:hypothetical protein